MERIPRKEYYACCQERDDFMKMMSADADEVALLTTHNLFLASPGVLKEREKESNGTIIAVS